MISSRSLWFQKIFKKKPHLKCSLKAYEPDTASVKIHYKDTGKLYQTDVGINCFDKPLTVSVRNVSYFIRVAECKNLQPAVITGYLHLFHVQTVCCFLLGLLFLGMFSFTVWKTPLYLGIVWQLLQLLSSLPSAAQFLFLCTQIPHQSITAADVVQARCYKSLSKMDLENFRRYVVMNNLPFCPSINQLLP